MKRIRLKVVRFARRSERNARHDLQSEIEITGLRNSSVNLPYKIQQITVPNWQVFVKKKRDAFFRRLHKSIAENRRRKFTTLLAVEEQRHIFDQPELKKILCHMSSRSIEHSQKKAVKNRLLCLVSESQNFSEEKMSVSCNADLSVWKFVPN